MEEDAEESEVANAEKARTPSGPRESEQRETENSEEAPPPQANKIWTSLESS